MATMTIIAFLLLLNPIFANGISFTAEQCQRFKNEGITGGDYYINEALARDCKIQVPESDGYLPLMVLNPNETHKKNCGMKNLALDGNNSGYFQDVVTFNDMHPDYFYPDRNDEYPFVFAIQVLQKNGGIEFSNGVSVDIDSVKGCREKVESLLGERLSSKNVIMTTAHGFITKKGDDCTKVNNNQLRKSAVATGKDVQKFTFKSNLENVICSANSCSEYERDGYNDFCIVIPTKDLLNSAAYEKIDEKNLNKKSYLVAYQPFLISSIKNKDIKRGERIISVNKDGHRLIKENKSVRSSESFITHHADMASGSSGGGLFSPDKKLIGINTTEGTAYDKEIQRGFKGTWAVNYAIDPQKACQRLSTVLN